MKKILVLAVFALMTAALFAQTEADFSVELTKDGTGVVITKYNGRVAAVRIPATIQDMPVKEIAVSAFCGNKTITSVVIPEGVISINYVSYSYEGAFSDCSNLTTVTLPSTLTSIGQRAFQDCRKLTDITIPKGVTKIGGRTFWGCSALRAIVIPEGIGVIEESTFTNCTALAAVTLPGTLTSIDEQAFWNCTALTTITLPSTIRRIDDSAFSGCRSLTTVTIPSEVEGIRFGEGTFQGCPRLTLASQAALKRVGYEDSF